MYSVDSHAGQHPVVVVFFKYPGHLSALPCSVIRTSGLNCLSSWPKLRTNGPKKKKMKTKERTENSNRQSVRDGCVCRPQLHHYER